MGEKENLKMIPVKTRRIIGVGIFFLFFSFFAYMGIFVAIKSAKTFDQLSYVEGKVTGMRRIKQKQHRRLIAVYKEIIVLTIEGTGVEFGFEEGHAAYKTLLTFRPIGQIASIYYDGVRKPADYGITLNTFDVKIGNHQIVRIADIKSRGKTISILFFSGALIFLVLIVVLMRKIRQP